MTINPGAPRGGGEGEKEEVGYKAEEGQGHAEKAQERTRDRGLRVHLTSTFPSWLLTNALWQARLVCRGGHKHAGSQTRRNTSRETNTNPLKKHTGGGKRANKFKRGKNKQKSYFAHNELKKEKEILP